MIKLSFFLLFLALIFPLSGREFRNSRSGLVSIEKKREELRPDRGAFDARFVSIDCRVIAHEPVHAAVFLKDKDGYYFQSEKDFELESGKWHTLTIPVDEKSRHWQGFGHRRSFDAMAVAAALECGVSFWCDKAQNLDVEVRDWRYSGKRRVFPLKVLNFELPGKGEVNKICEGRFELTREYFNCFDPEEIKVDCEVVCPDGKTLEFPAFATADFERSMAFAEERMDRIGGMYWALRYTPRTEGVHRIRVRAEDSSGARAFSPWREVRAENTGRKGFIGVSRKNPKFFEFDDGELFFPVGLNIHTNRDLRSEYRLKLGPFPDRGTYDYDHYFAECAGAGINCVEIWMASWTCALEWDSARRGYYGMGFYNLANAARLDHLFELAEKYGIYINLVWDNHGKFAASANQEWHDNPANRENYFARANGGFMTPKDDIFDNAELEKYLCRRNRYLAARFGQNPMIFAMELWSEVNLVFNARASYDKGTMTAQHSRIISDYLKHTPVRHLTTTHVSGDSGTNLSWIKLWEIPESTHLVGDAYRRESFPMADQMRKQSRELDLPRPVLITEFGGSSSGNANARLEADLHAGLWSAVFKRQAGLPFLWWHDFVILGNRLDHYRGVSAFVRGIDFRDAEWKCRESRAVNLDFFEFARPFWMRRYDAMMMMKKDGLAGWVFHVESMFEYPEKPWEEPWRTRAALKLPADFAPGRYRVDFYDTMTGKVVRSGVMELKRFLPLPPFQIDIAFQLRREKE